VAAAARTISTVAAAGSTVTSQPTTDAPSRANVRAVARPMLPPVPMMTQTFPASRPAISAIIIAALLLLPLACAEARR
jgi:hypothetical protein